MWLPSKWLIEPVFVLNASMPQCKARVSICIRKSSAQQHWFLTFTILAVFLLVVEILQDLVLRLHVSGSMPCMAPS
jgi:hypothetical protein